MAILPHLSRCYYIVRSRCYTGSNRSKEKGTRVKDRRKNGASKRAGLALVPFFARPKQKNSFLGLSLLRNHTEMLATQASSPCGPCSSSIPEVVIAVVVLVVGVVVAIVALVLM